MENSLNIPSSPSLPYFYTLQTSPWLILANSASWLLAKSPESGKGCPHITTPMGAHLPLSVRTQSSSSEENEGASPWDKSVLTEADARGAAQPRRELPGMGRCRSSMPRLPRALSCSSLPCHMPPPRATAWPPEAQIHDGR